MTSDAIEEIEHTADWAIRVRAKELSSLFEQAAKGMTDLIGQVQDNTSLIPRPITINIAGELAGRTFIHPRD
jgi:SHS2 domain-containing protein